MQITDNYFINWAWPQTLRKEAIRSSKCAEACTFWPLLVIDIEFIDNDVVSMCSVCGNNGKHATL